LLKLVEGLFSGDMNVMFLLSLGLAPSGCRGYGCTLGSDWSVQKPSHIC